jgi:hypothetical protein
MNCSTSAVKSAYAQAGAPTAGLTNRAAVITARENFFHATGLVHASFIGYSDQGAID